MRSRKQESRPFQFQPFEDLKKIIDRKGLTVSPPLTTVKEKQPTDEDLFIDAMSEVKEIKEFRAMAVRKGRRTTPRRETSPGDEALRAIEEIVSGLRPVSLPVTQEYVEWFSGDCRADVIAKLREGGFSVQDILDLHGLITGEAAAEVDLFLKQSIRKGLRCVKIIHGRGLRSPNGPVLKQALVRCLSGRYRKHIIAFVTARQCDGGLGALYVLLR